MTEKSKTADMRADLTELLEKIGFLGEAAVTGGGDRLQRLAQKIREWNDSINLVSRKDIGRLVSYHFCDSASLIPLVPRWTDIDVLDVGGSNGLPGLVLAAIMPDIRLIVCDSQKRRTAFLEDICGRQVRGREAIIPNSRFELGRIDSPGFQTAHAGFFDLIVARAVARMRPLVKWCLPLLKEDGGRLVAYKGSRSIEEMGQAEAYIFDHGGAMAAVVASPWSDTCNPLRLFVITERARHRQCPENCGPWKPV